MHAWKNVRLSTWNFPIIILSIMSFSFSFWFFCNSFNSIFVMVVYFTKLGHFAPCNKMTLGKRITKFFFYHIFCIMTSNFKTIELNSSYMQCHSIFSNLIFTKSIHFISISWLLLVMCMVKLHITDHYPITDQFFKLSSDVFHFKSLSSLLHFEWFKML